MVKAVVLKLIERQCVPSGGDILSADYQSLSVKDVGKADFSVAFEHDGTLAVIAALDEGIGWPFRIRMVDIFRHLLVAM